MDRGWDTSEWLPKVLALRGRTQEQLADATGIDRGTINGYCTGRLTLGTKNAERIAAALDVSLLDLGAPAESASAEAHFLRARLDELADKLADAIDRETKNARAILRLQARVRDLEDGHGRSAGAPTGQ